MQPADVMNMAVEHAAKAEEFCARGDLASARIHRELAALYVPMAREVRIGNNRSSTYREVVFKSVVVAEPPALAVEATDDDTEFDDLPSAPAPDWSSGT